MELLQLRYFCEVARRESVTKVAEELHVSQPSLSKTIKKPGTGTGSSPV